MEKIIRSLLFIAIYAVLNFSCKKNTDQQNQDFGDSLSEEDNAFLESLSIPNPSLHEILGHDGSLLGRPMQMQGPAGNLIDAMLRDAQTLSELKTHLYAGEGENRPEHMGLVYSRGQRNITQRLKPPFGNSLHKKSAVFGTDCSGFIINLFKHARVNIQEDSRVENFEANLKSALLNDSEFNTVTVKNIGYQPLNSIRTGDLILWIRSTGDNHMGIIANLSNQEKTVYQSNGTGTPSTATEQAKNLGLSRGVHPIKFNVAISSNPDPKKSYWGTGYQILRLKEKIAIGDTLDGGIVFYIDSTGTHGLISSLSDQSTSTNWFNAFKVCSEYRGGGYSDWFLPSVNQLDSMYKLRQVIGGFNSSCTSANFGECSYWSSTEISNDFAWNVYFVDGGWWDNYGKSGLGRVRAIRTF